MGLVFLGLAPRGWDGLGKPRHVPLKISALGCLLLLLFITGCTEPSPELTTSVPTTPTPSLIPSPTPVRPTPTLIPIDQAEILTIASPSAPPHYDVHQAFSPSLHTMGPGLVYSRLLRFRSDDNSNSFNLQLECDLCESWVQIDQLSYRFSLKKGVHWHNVSPVNGRELTSDDIIYSYERQATPGWDNAGLLENLQSLAKIDRYTFDVKARRPDADFLLSLANGHSKIVAKEAVSFFGDLRTAAPIGTGPWKWDDPSQGVDFQLRLNASYYEEAYPRAEILQVSIIPEIDTRFTALVLGNVDIAEVPLRKMTSIENQYPRIRTLEIHHYGQGPELVMNTNAHPFHDVEIRQAVFKAMNPWGYIDEIWEGGVFTGLGMPLVNEEWLLPPEELESFWDNPEAATNTLKESNLQLEIALTIADYGDEYIALGNRIAEDLEAVGFELETIVLTPLEYVDQVWGEGRYAIVLGPLTPITTPNDYFLGVLHSKGLGNTTHHQNTDLDELLDIQSDVIDPIIRRELADQIQRKALTEAVRFMPVTRTSLWAWQSSVERFTPNLAGYEYFYYARASKPNP